MRAALAARDLAALRFRERVTLAVRLRIEGADREAVRRGAAFFALPQNAVTGARLIWDTADAIWTALGRQIGRPELVQQTGDAVGGLFGHRALLAGDETPGHEATWAFLDRRIEDVMRFEKLKAQVRDNPTITRLSEGPLKGPLELIGRIRAPGGLPRDLPGENMGPGVSLPSEMRVVEIARPGGPEVLLAARRPVPEPGVGKILIRVAYAGREPTRCAATCGRLCAAAGGLAPGGAGRRGACGGCGAGGDGLGGR